MKTTGLHLICFVLFFPLLSAAPPNDGGNRGTEEREHLFPGTGFFVKNREPYDEAVARKWFFDADRFHKEGELGDALGLYEKFAKRRSDLVVNVNGSSILVGGEALYRAAILRESKGDWKDAFNHLELLAVAYPRYDFERVAEALMRLAEKLAKDDLPRKWGVVPRFRSGSEDRARLNRIAELSRGPQFAPRALMALAEIALKEEKEEDAIDALERMVNFYPENYLCEKAYFMLAEIYQDRVSGPAYDQGSTLKALNFFEDYLLLFDRAPDRGKHESYEAYKERLNQYSDRKKNAQTGKRNMRQTLAASKLEVGSYVEKYGKYFILHWEELGNQPALQFYNEAITTAPESDAARLAEKRVAALRSSDD